MTGQSKKLLLEMAAIILVAAAVGIAWNHRMLLDVFSGKAVAGTAGPADAAEPAADLVPTGLAQARELFQTNGAVFIDAREVSAYRQGHIRGALSMPVGELDARLAELRARVDADAVLVIYCSGFGCNDSKTVGRKLAENGYRQILIFEGGYPEWKDAGLPVVEGARS